MTLTNLARKWIYSSKKRDGLDTLFSRVPQPSWPVRERIQWVVRLVRWIRNPGLSIAITEASRSAKLPNVRLRFIMQWLESNLETKARVADLLRSLVRDTQSLDLFVSVGIPNEQGFIGEMIERFHQFLPQPPDDKNLIALFSDTFNSQSDAHWIKVMPPEIFEGLVSLFYYSETEQNWNSFIEELKSALTLLAETACAMGISKFIRTRLNTEDHSDFRALPFFQLSKKIEDLLIASEREKVIENYRSLCKTIDSCLECLQKINQHFKDQGVSIALVYQTERLSALLNRISTLARLYVGYENDPSFIHDFFAHLVEENNRARSMGGLLSDNISLVCHKIVETNAETGDHYISRDRSEQSIIFRSAAGGGVVTALTTFVKVILHHLSLAPFIWGVLASLNYALSFLLIQFLGFTLATKQPAMTATYLASKLEDRGQDLSIIVDEILHLLRSQITTVFGNMITVIPTVFVANFLLNCCGISLLDHHHALDMMDNFSIFGRTPFLAAWTGLLLWASSVFSGLFANWFTFRKLPEAIEHHPRVVFVLGEERSKKWVHYLTHNIGGYAANISLGFLLGMSLPLGSFFGVPLDVRHITLSTGIMTVACSSLGTTVFSQAVFWKACGGLLSMAVLNLGVSFSLALLVAIWARKTSAPSPHKLYLQMIKRLAHSPLLLFFPKKLDGPIGLESK